MSFCKELLYLIPEHWIENRINSLKNVKWKNERSSGKAYVPTNVEHVANVLTHGVWIPYSIYGTYLLLEHSTTKLQVVAGIVYGLSLIFCFTVSTCFHCVHYSGHNRLKEWLHRGDRAMIYIFIASSIFPWLLLRPLPDGLWVTHLWWFIWVLAFLGITYQQIFHEKYKTLETCIYLFVAIGPSSVLLSYNSGPAFDKIKLGGVLYMMGVAFFKSDGKIPFAHAIWHLFVATAASIHYFAVLEYLYH